MSAAGGGALSPQVLFGSGFECHGVPGGVFLLRPEVGLGFVGVQPELRLGSLKAPCDSGGYRA